jgi:DNA-binding NarL/FixJ family response regulator
LALSSNNIAIVRIKMPRQVTLALIVARPGPLRNSLQALMTTMPQIEVLAETSDPSALLRMGAEIQPDIVLLDADLPEDQVWATLRQIKEGWCQTRSIVLVEDSQQQQRAQAAGADAALIKGYPAAKLIAAVEGLLP